MRQRGPVGRAYVDMGSSLSGAGVRAEANTWTALIF